MADDGDASYEDWQLVGDWYFERRELYQLSWCQHTSSGPGLNLDYMRIFAAPFGGPIAMCRDEGKVVLHLGAFSRPDIQLFSPSGAPLGRVLWDKGRIVAAGWTSMEELLVVDDGGRVHRFSLHGAHSGEGFSLGAACEEEGLALAAVFADGVVALTSSGHLWCVADAREPRLQRLPDPSPGAMGEVHCLVAVPPAISLSGSLEVLVAVDSTVVVVDADDVCPTAVTEGPIVNLAISPDGRHVAGFAADGVVHIWTADHNLTDSVAQVALIDTADDLAEALGHDGWRDSEGEGEGGSSPGIPGSAPDCMAWCGLDGVVGWWQGVGALVVTVQGMWRWWDLGPVGAAALVGEVDGVRVLTPDRHLLLRRVPAPLASVLEPGATSPGALLYDARRLYESRDARAAAELLEVLRTGGLPSAVAACLGAAAAELHPTKQEALMRAGCYGRAFLALQDAAGAPTASPATLKLAGLGSKDTVTIARRLRVINALREESIALPLTLPQLDALGVGPLAARLTARRHYLLALRVCEALGASRDEVLVRWACDKISSSVTSSSDEELLGVLQFKLQGRTGVRWSHVASHAQGLGRRGLAAALLEHEAVAGEQVPLLLELGEDERALSKAVDCGDSDLVFEVVQAMWRRVERSGGGGGEAAQFWAVVGARPSAASLLAKFFQKRDPALALAMCEALVDHAGAAELHLRAALAAAGAAAGAAPGGAPMPEVLVQREFAQARDAFARAERDKKDDRFEAAAVAAGARLRDVQAELQASSGREGFLGLSAVDTVRQCLRLGMKDAAQRVAREFKVPEKQQALAAVQAAAAQHDWTALVHMAGRLDRRAPISVDHVVAAARAQGAPLPTVRSLVDLITGDNALVRRATLYAELGLQREAAALLEQAELQGVGAGVLGSLREAVGGGLMGRMMGGRG